MHTPRLDALAAEGLHFTQAYAAAPVCAPSRCSLLTGLHSGHATVRNNPFGPGGQGALTDKDFTFAEALRALGYRTAPGTRPPRPAWTPANTSRRTGRSPAPRSPPPPRSPAGARPTTGTTR
ncbi:sulfatase-like hydrolase/transferase [Streptomyces sasae]|uniref:sulfatase-like hydrolase/transferase n=1 Tax=Streptomyces sasae TaxID=1266772 RepID=UPI003742F518